MHTEFSCTKESVQDEFRAAVSGFVTGIDGMKFMNKYGDSTLDAQAVRNLNLSKENSTSETPQIHNILKKINSYHQNMVSKYTEPNQTPN